MWVSQLVLCAAYDFTLYIASFYSSAFSWFSFQCNKHSPLVCLLANVDS